MSEDPTHRLIIEARERDLELHSTIHALLQLGAAIIEHSLMLEEVRQRWDAVRQAAAPGGNEDPAEELLNLDFEDRGRLILAARPGAESAVMAITSPDFDALVALLWDHEGDGLIGGVVSQFAGDALRAVQWCAAVRRGIEVEETEE